MSSTIKLLAGLFALGMTCCGGAPFEMAPQDSQTSAVSPTDAGSTTVCTVALDDGGTRDYAACVGTGSVYATVSWHTGHFCDTVDLADGGTAWQLDTNYVPCAASQPCIVVDQNVPTNTRDTFFGSCR